jgi:hypothetical protein
MNLLFASEIGLHLATGRRHTFYQEGLFLVPSISDDSDPSIFDRPGYVHDGEKVITKYGGNDVFGITVLARWPYDFFFERERALGIVVREIGQDGEGAHQINCACNWNSTPFVVNPATDRRPKIYSELQFKTGMKLFLEFTQIAEEGICEDTVLHHIFSHSSLCCRRLGGGLSIWNTDHIVSWQSFPRLVVMTGNELVDLAGEPLPAFQIH